MSKIGNIKLFEAVYNAVKKRAEAGLFPQEYLPGGTILERAVDKRYVVLAPNGLIYKNSAAAAITVRDANNDMNRFTGTSPVPYIRNQGGLYLFRHEEAGLAEIMFYSEKMNTLPMNTATRRISVSHMMATKSIFRIRVTKPLILANISLLSGGGEAKRFFDEVGNETNVKNLLYGATLSQKMLDPNDYSVSRAFGLALATINYINGIQSQTARVTDRTYLSGDNVCLFGENMQPVSGLEVDSAKLTFSSSMLFDDAGKQIKMDDKDEAFINNLIPDATNTEYTLTIEVDNGFKQGMKIT